MKKIVIGADPNASELKNNIMQMLKNEGYECEDFGSDDIIYANVAIKVAEAVVRSDYDRGILICSTGIGMSIAANKVKGAHAALCSDAYSAERASRSNNAKIITLGAQVIGPKLAEKLVMIWLNAEYVLGERSEPKINRIIEYEEELRLP